MNTDQPPPLSERLREIGQALKTTNLHRAREVTGLASGAWRLERVEQSAIATATERDRLRTVNAELLGALETARNGLAWYRDTFPNVTDGIDDEAMAQIDAAMASARTA